MTHDRGKQTTPGRGSQRTGSLLLGPGATWTRYRLVNQVVLEGATPEHKGTCFGKEDAGRSEPSQKEGSAESDGQVPAGLPSARAADSCSSPSP